MNSISSFKEYMLMAIDPETLPEKLNTLIFEVCEVNRLKESDIGYAERLLLSALATNPNTHISGLVALANHVPDQVAINPALNFLLIENPLLFKEFSVSSLRSFLQVSGFAKKFGLLILNQIVNESIVNEDLIRRAHRESLINSFWNTSILVQFWNDFVGKVRSPIKLKSSCFNEGYYVNVKFNNLTIDSGAALIFVNCRFDKCIFQDINVNDLYGLQFLGCDLTRSNFTNIKVKSIVFRQCDLTSSIFYNCNLPGSIFDRCELGDVHFGCCDLSGSLLEKNKAGWDSVRAELSNLTDIKLKDSDQLFRGKNDQFS